MDATTEAASPFVLPTTPSWLDAVISAAVIVQCLVAVAMNPLTILAIWKGGLAKKSATNIFIANLSVSDFFSALSAFCLEVHKWVSAMHGASTALVVSSWVNCTLIAIAYAGSLVTSLVIGFDRALATSNPLNYKRLMTTRTAKLMVTGLWAFLVCTVLVPVFYHVATLDPAQRSPPITNPTKIHPPEYAVASATRCSTPKCCTRTGKQRAGSRAAATRSSRGN
jgi:hypothetical protein